VAESLGLFGTAFMRKSLAFRHAPGVIRTHNLLIRSQMLYPIELRVRKDRQANAKVREVKQTGSRKTMLRRALPLNLLSKFSGRHPGRLGKEPAE
jgi:hypothetical protein